MKTIKYLKLKELDLKEKRIFLRADLNIPLSDNKILQDFKLQKILPTINYILEKGGKVILATHIGRPNASAHTNFFDKELSTQILIPWFEKNNYKIRYEVDLKKAQILSRQNFNEILLLENLRFFNGEKGELQERKKFVDFLKDTADIYVNDAFALAHRQDTSVTLLPESFQLKAAGLLVEKEFIKLKKIKEKPINPFLLILGGNKLKTKIPLLQNLVQKNKNYPTSIIIGGAIADFFLNPKESDQSNNKIEKNEIEFVQNFLKTAKDKNIKIILPIDQNNGDIGIETIKTFISQIKQAKTIFINGTMGIYEKPETQLGTKKVLNAVISNSKAYKVAGGGDCIAAIHLFQLEDRFSFLSTGGGATLAFLADQEINIKI